MVLFFAVLGFTQESWQRISPLPQEQTLNAVATIPWNGNVIATGEGSTVMISDDEGESWEIMHCPGGVSSSFTGQGFDFVLPNTIYLYGSYNTILKSTNGGFSWSLEYQGSIRANEIMFDLEFVDSIHGYSICQNPVFQNEVFETHDGGFTWDSVTSVPAGHKYSIEFKNSQLGVLLGFGSKLYRTINGGETWIQVFLPDTIDFIPHSDIVFLNDSIILIDGALDCYGFGTNTNIIRSCDNGETWENVFDDNSNGVWNNLVFFNDQEGIFDVSGVGYCRTTFLTSNGGITWEESDSYPYYANYMEGMACSVISESKAISVGINGATHLSCDKGATWQCYSSRMINSTVFQSWFFEDGKCIAHCDSGPGGGVSSENLYKSENSGETWQYHNNYSQSELSFDFISGDTGFMVYKEFQSKIFAKTTDGGDTWNDEVVGSNNYIHTGIEFYNSQYGVIPAWYGLMYTDDGGENWNVSNGGEVIDVWFKNVTFTNDQRVFAAGNNFDEQSAVWKSDDSGANWSPVIEIDGDGFEVVYFFDENRGFIAGYQNYIYRTNNSGNSWEKVSRPEGGVIYDIHFPSQNVGYAVGSGRILKTYNGGESWIRLSTNLVANLYTVHFFDENNGIVMGENGLILRTDNGGTTFIEEKPAIPQQPSAINLFPNPASDILNITFEDPQQAGELIFYTTNGTEVMRRAHNPNVTGIIMNVQTMDAGAYVVQYVVDGQVIASDKIIIAQ